MNWKMVGIPSAILACIGIGAAVGLEKPWVDKNTFAQLEQKTIDTFDVIQQQAQGYRVDSAQSWCEHYRREVIRLEQLALEMPDNLYLLNERDWAADQRDRWCAEF